MAMSAGTNTMTTVITAGITNTIIMTMTTKQRGMMNASHTRLHPLMALAAISVTAFSLLGIGAITGLVTPAHSDRMEMSPVQTPAETLAANDQKAPKSEAVTKAEAKTTASSTPAAQHGNTPGKSGTLSDAGKGTRQPSKGANACAACGQIESISLVKHDGEASGLGAVTGGVAGGVVGNQIGSGKGNILMTLLGIGGGAYAGHTIEKKIKATSSYVVKVNMQDGSKRTVTQTEKPMFAVGDQVRITNGRLAAMS
jgi:outer membrane lipoprotein SlyB